MNKINLNEYIVCCLGLIGFTAYLLYGSSGDMSYKNYDEEILWYIYRLWGAILFLPFELASGKIAWFIFKKEDFEISFLFGERKVLVK